MLRINLNLTIVTMVVPRPKIASSIQCEEENVVSLWKNTTFNESIDTSIEVDEQRLVFENTTVINYLH